MLNQIEQTKVDPNFINFGLGYPHPSLLPDQLLVNSGASLAQNPHRNSILQYGYVSGYNDFRVKLANFIKRQTGRNVQSDNLFITNGVSGGLQLVCDLLASNDDCVLVEDSSYFIGLKILQGRNYRLEVVETIDGCIDLEGLENRLKNGLRPKFFYLIPYHHNPRGYNWTASSKKALINLSQIYGFYIVSDEVYHLLSWPGEAKSDEDWTPSKETTLIALNTFSKILAPGLRLGWIESSRDIVEKLCNHPVIVSGGAVNPIGTLLVEPLLNNDLAKENWQLDEHLKSLKCTLQFQGVSMSNELVDWQKEEPKISFKLPNGGYFIWVEFPEQWVSSSEYNQFLLDRYKVKVQPGINFSPTRNRFLNCCRLSFSYYDQTSISEGMKRLLSGYRHYRNEYGGLPTPLQNLDSQIVPIMVYGYRGRMGSNIMAQSELAKSLGFELVGLNKDLSNLRSSGIVIDVSSPEGLEFLLTKLSGQILIVGTTGVLPVRAIEEYRSLYKTKAVLCPNFSEGVELIKKMLPLVSDSWTVDIVELHHSQKRDNPSGTALDLSKIVPTCKSIHGIRGGSNFGEHLIFLQQEGEMIEIRHHCLDRKVFGAGAIKLANTLLKVSK